jgi:PhzF family phenazine biosynthesis protein
MQKLLTFYKVNAFTNYAFSGNPASVILLDKHLADVTCLQLAAEMSTPETAFVVPLAEKNTFSLRFFMPTQETKMCGHATFAAAYILFRQNICKDIAIFNTLSGTITAKLLENGKIALDFPADTFEEFVPSREFLDKIGIEKPLSAVYAPTRNLAILQVENLAILQNLQINFEILKKHQELQIKKLAITTNGLQTVLQTKNSTQQATNYDFVSRCFCPWIGIDEDALSAASHTLLAKFWANRIPKTSFKAFQASARTGELEIVLKENQRMDLIGEGFLSLEGKVYFI